VDGPTRRTSHRQWAVELGGAPPSGAEAGGGVEVQAWVRPVERQALLFDLARARLVDARVLVPGASVLARMVARVRERVATRLWSRLARMLDDDYRQRLDALLECPTARGCPASSSCDDRRPPSPPAQWRWRWSGSATCAPSMPAAWTCGGCRRRVWPSSPATPPRPAPTTRPISRPSAGPPPSSPSPRGRDARRRPRAGRVLRPAAGPDRPGAAPGPGRAARGSGPSPQSTPPHRRCETPWRCCWTPPSPTTRCGPRCPARRAGGAPPPWPTASARSARPMTTSRPSCSPATPWCASSCRRCWPRSTSRTAPRAAQHSRRLRTMRALERAQEGGLRRGATETAQPGMAASGRRAGRAARPPGVHLRRARAAAGGAAGP
jgi:hypothetical protein